MQPFNPNQQGLTRGQLSNPSAQLELAARDFLSPLGEMSRFAREPYTLTIIALSALCIYIKTLKESVYHDAYHNGFLHIDHPETQFCELMSESRAHEYIVITFLTRLLGLALIFGALGVLHIFRKKNTLVSPEELTYLNNRNSILTGDFLEMNQEQFLTVIPNEDGWHENNTFEEPMAPIEEAHDHPLQTNLLTNSETNDSESMNSLFDSIIHLPEEMFHLTNPFETEELSRHFQNFIDFTIGQLSVFEYPSIERAFLFLKYYISLLNHQQIENNRVEPHGFIILILQAITEYFKVAPRDASFRANAQFLAVHRPYLNEFMATGKTYLFPTITLGDQIHNLDLFLNHIINN